MVPSVKYRFSKQIICVIVLAICCLLYTAYCYALVPRYVRVLVAKDILFLNLKINGPYEISDAKNDKVLNRGNNLKTTVTSSKSGILIGNIATNTNNLFIKTDSSSVIMIDGRKFTGRVQLIKESNFKLLAINHVDLEDYVKGILYHEVSHYWPIDALKAQTVICRTFALYNMQRNKLKDYDLTKDIYSQVYGGRTSERYRTNKAVDETKNQILVYQGKIFPAFYHATCAGHTEDASLYWDNVNIEPLKGVYCGFCKDSPHFNWHVVLSKEDIRNKLIKSGYKIKDIKDIILLDRNKSGRITNVNIVTDGEGVIKIPAKDFRNILGPNIIKSTNFEVKIINDDVIFQGLGWGHGIGLCQWGAYFMAKQGYGYEQILKYYYPGAELSSI